MSEKARVCGAAQGFRLGEFVSAQYDDSSAGDDYWRVITHDVNGDEVVVLINDEDGSVVIP